MKKVIIRSVISWLPLSVAIVCIYGIMYLVVQQYIRLSANEILTEYAENTRSKLENGMTPDSIIKEIPKIDMAKSLSPFVMIYNNARILIASSASLKENYPAIATGTLDYAEKNNGNKVTWQPQQEVRNATVILHCTKDGQGYFILAGRSLREIENREHFVLLQTFAGMMLTLFATFVMVVIVQGFKRRLSKYFYST